jgi:hypothetical protein
MMEEEEIPLKEIHEKELELNEENLIDFVEELFLSGKERSINYHDIDQDSSLDNRELIDRDEEEKYFDDIEDDGIRDE